MRIMFVGDINLGEYYTSFGHGPASYLKHSDVFKNVRTIFSEADFVVGNLEAALTTNNLDHSNPESAVLRGDPNHASLLGEVGFKVLQVANNHTVQHGKEGFDEAVQALRSSDIFAVGMNNQDTVKVKLGEETIGFLAASDVPDNTDKSQQSYQKLDSEFIEKAIAEVNEVDHLFVMLHWGLEASTRPMEYQRKLIQKLSAAGVRGVIGTHPHLFYDVWIEENTIAAPSLGDFVFDLGWDKRLLQTGILDIQISEKQLEAKVWPIEIMNNGCMPTPTGPPIPVNPDVKLYDLGEDMAGEQKRKLIYFISNFYKGDINLKTKFIFKKLSFFLKNKMQGISNG